MHTEKMGVQKFDWLSENLEILKCHKYQRADNRNNIEHKGLCDGKANCQN